MVNIKDSLKRDKCEYCNINIGVHRIYAIPLGNNQYKKLKKQTKLCINCIKEKSKLMKRGLLK
jgi:hypothetical protein